MLIQLIMKVGVIPCEAPDGVFKLEKPLDLNDFIVILYNDYQYK
jgi:hypothetical protein